VLKRQKRMGQTSRIAGPVLSPAFARFARAIGERSSSEVPGKKLFVEVTEVVTASCI
jgi:hypothetical protein